VYGIYLTVYQIRYHGAFVKTRRNVTPPSRPTRIDLLWRSAESGNRGPKRGLTIPGIAKAGIEIADRDGLAGLTMQRVAHRLGVTTMALYRYVPGKAELIEIMLDAVVEGAPEVALVRGGWRPKLELWTRKNIALYPRHPWLLEVPITGPPIGPNRLEWLEAGLSALAEVDLTGSEMVAVVLLLDGFARGAAQLAVGAAKAARHPGSTRDDWGAAFARVIEPLIDPTRFPTLSSLLGSGTFDARRRRPDHDPIEFGLGRVMDGIATLIRKRAKAS